MSTNLRKFHFLDTFDTGDVLYNWSISLLPPIVLDNLFGVNKKDSSTIDGNVEFVHSQYSCILTSQVSIQFSCPTRLLIIVIILEKNAYLAENKLNYMFSLFSVLHFFM